MCLMYCTVYCTYSMNGSMKCVVFQYTREVKEAREKLEDFQQIHLRNVNQKPKQTASLASCARATTASCSQVLEEERHRYCHVLQSVCNVIRNEASHHSKVLLSSHSPR